MKDTTIPMSKFPGLKKASEAFSPFDILAFTTDPGYGYDDVKMLLLKFHNKPGKYDNKDGLGLCIYNVATHEFIEEPSDLTDYNEGNLTEDTLYRRYHLKRSSYVPTEEKITTHDMKHFKRFEQFINESKEKPKMTKAELKKRVADEAKRMFDDIKQQGGGMTLADCKKEAEKTFKEEYIIEDYSSRDVMGSKDFVDKDWDALYDEAHKSPLKNKIKKALVQVFKDKNVMGLVGDNFHWSDGSNGMMNFDNLNHYITDIGYKCYADKGIEIFDNIEELKKYILYAYASSKPSSFSIYDRFQNKKYDPSDDFSW